METPERKPNSEKRKPKNPINFNIQLNEEQKQAKSDILNNTVTLLKGQAGSGKANWWKTPVLTPDGYKFMGEISPGDYVLSEKGKPIKVLNIYPQGIQKIYKITFSDGSTTHCTEDHLWNVIDRNNIHRKFNKNGTPNIKYQIYETLSLKEILNKGLFSGKKTKWFIPLSSPVEYKDNELELDPYILGCLLGDGCFIGTPNITTTDEDILKYFKNYFKNLDMNVTPSYDNSITHNISSGRNKQIEYNGNIYDSIESLKKHLKISHGTFYKRINNGTYVLKEIKNKLTDFLIRKNLYNKNSFEKHIPDEYLYTSVNNRIALLQGLLDTDGWIDITKFRTNKGYSSSVNFCTTSKQLKNDVIKLVNSLGGICYVNERLGKYKAKGEKEYKETSLNYRIKIAFNNHEIEQHLFKLERKQSKVILSKNIINRSISKVEYVFDDYAQCILVDSPTHLYLTDNYIVTHNTLLACQVALDLFFTRQVEKIIITRPVVAAADDIGYLPGSMKEKMDPWLAPIYANLYMLYNKETIDKMVERQEIEILPFTFVRGRTFVNSIVIVDECQNVNHTQTEMIVGRLGLNSRMVFCGDTSQIDLKNKKESGIDFFKTLESRVEGVKVIVLKQNHRHPIVPQILDIYREYSA